VIRRRLERALPVASVLLAAATLVLLAVALVAQARASAEQSDRLQATAEDNQQLLADVQHLLELVRAEGMARTADLQAVAGRMEELHGSDPASAPQLGAASPARPQPPAPPAPTPERPCTVDLPVVGCVVD
jgi:hypothetical protein